MFDIYLKFTDELQANSILYTKVPTAWSESVSMDEPPVATEWMDKPNYDNIDVIGTIYKPTGTMLTNEEGMEYPEMEAIEGWHINIRHSSSAPELDQYAVDVKTPSRIWG
jgi:hypothetical protein